MQEFSWNAVVSVSLIAISLPLTKILFTILLLALILENRSFQSKDLCDTYSNFLTRFIFIYLAFIA